MKTGLSKFGYHVNVNIDVYVKIKMFPCRQFLGKVAYFGGRSLICFEVIQLFRDWVLNQSARWTEYVVFNVLSVRQDIQCFFLASWIGCLFGLDRSRESFRVWRFGLVWFSKKNLQKIIIPRCDFEKVNEFCIRNEMN